METLQQFFITVIATFVIFILFARITIATSTHNHGHHHKLKSSINEKSGTKTNTKKKKVRFAIDNDDEYVVNKVILEPSETQSVVFDEPMEDDLVIDYDQTEMSSVGENVGSCSKDEINCVKLVCDEIDEDLKEKEGLVSDEDDDSLDDGWEGIERSEWEKAFVFASSYGHLDDNLKSLEGDAQPMAL
uniref:uncharacterized protein LOC122588223 n=1 Tax=Erigeron canadensis TaxID=72917 RepID=UPI001CB94DAE|nr:uncharacterized protein LOC122588223 [Erigeron canadensis]